MTPEMRDRLLVLVGGGATIDRLAEAAGVKPRSVKRWLAAGRADPESEFASLARAFDAGPGPAAIGAGAMTDEEFELHLAAAIRARNVQAMKIYEERRRRTEEPDEVTPGRSMIDELAARRGVQVSSSGA